MNVMEITVPRGSMRLVAFPTFGEFQPNYRIEYYWYRMTEAQKFDYYSKKKKRFIGQQCHCIKAFVKQHKKARRNGHN